MRRHLLRTLQNHRPTQLRQSVVQYVRLCTLFSQRGLSTVGLVGWYSIGRFAVPVTVLIRRGGRMRAGGWRGILRYEAEKVEDGYVGGGGLRSWVCWRRRGGAAGWARRDGGAPRRGTSRD